MQGETGIFSTLEVNSQPPLKYLWIFCFLQGDLGAPLVCHLQQKDTWVQVGILSHFDEHCKKPYIFSQVSPFLFWIRGVTRPSHAPWSQQGHMTTSASYSLSVSTSTNASAVTTNPTSIRPHFISLPQPQSKAPKGSSEGDMRRKGREEDIGSRREREINLFLKNALIFLYQPSNRNNFPYDGLQRPFILCVLLKFHNIPM